VHTNTHTHTHNTHYCSTDTVILNLTPTWHSVTNNALTCVIPGYVMRQSSQIYPSKGVQMGVKGKSLSNNPTVAHNSKHYSVQTTGRCNTPRFISSLLIQSVASNTDLSSRFFMSCFAADIPLVVQTNWYYQLYLAHLTMDLLHCLLCRWLLFRPNNIQDMLKDKWSVSERILTPFLVKQWHLTHSHTFFSTTKQS